MSKETNIKCDGKGCKRNLNDTNFNAIRTRGGMGEKIKSQKNNLYLCDDCFINRNYELKYKPVEEKNAK